MSKFELSISPDYCSEWTLIDAVRELFQNALDQKGMIHTYSDGVLSIGNKNSHLSIDSLLLGASTKRDDSSTIGKFGEGYKIATLVLVRLGLTVTFFNGKETWRPRFVKSRRYNSQVLTFFIDKGLFVHPNANLLIEIEGINQSEYDDIVASNLHLQDDLGDTIENRFGRILLSDEHKGKVYVNGLFICKHEPYAYGYDFKPEFIKLDRDRKLATDFELQWLSSRMWAVAEPSPILMDLVAKGAADVTHVAANVNFYSNDIPNGALSKFIEDHGKDAVPVSDQEELDKVQDGFKPVMVSSNYKRLICSSPSYTAPEIKEDEPSKLEVWFEKAKDYLPRELQDEFITLMEVDDEI